MEPLDIACLLIVAFAIGMLIQANYIRHLYKKIDELKNAQKLNGSNVVLGAFAHSEMTKLQKVFHDE